MNALLLLSLLAADAEPAPAPMAPKGAAPQLVYFKDGKIVRFVTQAVPVTVEKEVTRVVDGKEVKDKITVTEYRTESREIATPLAKGAKLSTAAGKKLEGEDAEKALKKEGVAVLSFGPVDAAYLKAFKGDILVIEQDRAIRPIRPVPLPGPGVRPLPRPVPPGVVVPLPKIEIKPLPAPVPPDAVKPLPPVKE
ncbi:MAG: hypothetical protein K2W96_03655 [Gemmataceae bacterium]|nr:hypothetical protein [Gemmataceae bacterium]